MIHKKNKKKKILKMNKFDGWGKWKNFKSVYFILIQMRLWNNRDRGDLYEEYENRPNGVELSDECKKMMKWLLFVLEFITVYLFIKGKVNVKIFMPI